MRTIISLALPLFVVGVMLGSFGGLVKTAEAADEASTEAAAEDDALESEARAAQPGDEEEEGEAGYGYVFALPDGEPMDAAEKAAEMERAAVLARLGSGWETGEILAEDLQILVASARSQLETYQQELERLGRMAETEADLEALGTRHAEARANLEAFEEAGRRLRQSMTALKTDFEAVDLEIDVRAARPPR
jgi:hypothetical protein